MMRRSLIYLILILCAGEVLFAAGDSLRKRQFLVGGSTGLFATGTLLALNQVWYKPYSTGQFHFFDDNHEWLQMDKAGHVFSTYQSARLLLQACDWAGFSPTAKYGIGAGAGFVFMTVIEVMDGYSKGWGYSWGDQVADGLGTGMTLLQDLYWKEQRLQLKLSYAPSGYARYNPNLLGRNFKEQLLKDYNGQTYWLSLNPASFFSKKRSLLHALNIAFGYSADGMLGAENNIKAALQPDGTLIVAERRRQFFLSLDLDLRKLNVRSKLLRSVLSVVQVIKIPAPALEFSTHGLKLHGFYF